MSRAKLKNNLNPKNLPPQSPLTKTDPFGYWYFLELFALLWAGINIYYYYQSFPIVSQVFYSFYTSLKLIPEFGTALFYGFNLLLWLGICAGALFLGDCALSRLKLVWNSSLEMLVFSFAAGLGFLAMVVLAMAAAHLFYKAAFVALWLLGVSGFIYRMSNPLSRVQYINAANECKRLFWGQGNSWAQRAALAIFLLIGLYMACVPDLFYDALVYHLGVPNLYLQEHGLVRIPGATSRFPMLWQILYAFGLSLTDEILPKMLHQTTGFLILLAGAAFANRFNVLQSGLRLLPALLFLSVPMVQMNIWTGGVDAGGCLFAFLALYALCNWVSLKEDETSAKHWLALSGIMAGFAYGSKYQGGIVAVALLLTMWGALLLDKQKDWKIYFKWGALFGVVVLVTVLPWLIKNLWDTGNPVFPFLSSLFNRMHWQNYNIMPDQMEGLLGENRRFSASGLKEVLELPWILTFKNNSSLSYPGPLLLAFLPFNLLALRYLKKRWFQALLIFITLYFAFSMKSTHLTRYHLQGYAPLCLFMSIGLSVIYERRNIFFTGAVSTVLFLGALSNFQTGLFIISNSYRPWDVWTGSESRADYRSYTHPGLNPYPSNQMFRWMEKNLGKNTRTLMLGESKNFDLHLPYLYTDVHDRNPLIRWSESAKDGEELYGLFKAAGVTHLFMNFDEARRTYGYKMIKWQDHSLAVFNDFWQNHVREVHRDRIPEKFFNSQSVLLLYEIIDIQTAKQNQGPPTNAIAVLESAPKS